MPRMPTRLLRIVLPGGSGQVGTIVARHVQAQGHDVVVFARNATRAPWRIVQWDGTTLNRWAEELENADLVLNLAGRNVNCRYNESNRREIKESRTRTTRLLGQAISRLTHPPKIWMNASTATIYRHALDRPMDEATGEIGGNEPKAPSTWRFSIDVATSWENEFFAAKTPATRKIALRSAMVMSPDRDGIFDTLLRLVRFGLGGASGSGKQFVSWIHDEDFLRSIQLPAILCSVRGRYAPNVDWENIAGCHQRLFVGHKLNHKRKIISAKQAKSFREASSASHRSNGAGCGNRSDNISSTIPQNAHTCQ